ncbi:MAG: hypothetical protein KF850_15260 [Labilithrix sp.]|nr:hypothetical protein [Labilithrix sp.]
MTTPDDDRELRARFAELARRDRGRAPDFEAMWRARRPARSPWRLLVPAASLAAAAMFALWCGPLGLLGTSSPESAAPVAVAASSASPAPHPASGAGAPPAAEMPSAGAARAFDPAPLDFLLDVPGSAPRALGAAGLDSNPLKGW